MNRELTLGIDFFSSGHFGTKLLWSIGFDPRVLNIYPIPTLLYRFSQTFDFDI